LSTAATETYSTFLQLFVGEELLISQDVSSVREGESISIQTPTPINSVGYIFKLLTIPSE